MDVSSQKEDGYTLVEAIVAIAVLSIVILGITQFITPMSRAFQRSRTRQQANLEMRTCMETIERVMTTGRASTLVISTAPNAPPNSTASFQSLDQTSYVITWSSSPLNTVQLQQTPFHGTTTTMALATSVTGLNFGFGANDPGLINLSVTMTYALDSSGTPDSYLTIFYPNQTLRMNAS